MIKQASQPLLSESTKEENNEETNIFRVTGLLPIGLIFGTNCVHAQTAGSLDPTFGTDGTVTTTITGNTIIPIGALEHSNGDIVVLSRFAFVEGFGTQMTLTRYSQDERGLC